MADDVTGESMAAGMTDGKLSYMLLLIHSVQWITGTKGDPYALLLRSANDDPYELGRRARARGPVYRSHAGTWVTADHAVAATALGDPRLSPRYAEPREPDPRADAERVVPYELPRLDQLLPLDRAALTLDRPTYERLHRLTGSVLDAAALDRLHERTTSRCADRLRTLGDDFDLREDFAHPVAAATGADLLGFEDTHRERFEKLCTGTTGALDATLCPPQLATARRLVEAITGMRELIDESTGCGGAPLGGGLAGASAVDVADVCSALAITGVETTANLICEAMYALLADPKQWALVRDDPARAAEAVDETMRYSPPVRLHRLFAHQDAELAGQAVRAGDELVVLSEAAGRDPAAYDDPDRFSIERQIRAAGPVLPDGPLTGLAGPSVRRQAAAAISTLAAELPRMRRTGQVVRRPRSPVTRAMVRFPVAAR